MPFDPNSYGPQVADILALDQAEQARDRLMNADARALFPGARDPESALSALFLHFGCLTEAHDLLHRFDTQDGMYWHGIMHRMEGDASNAGYWFRHLGRHPIFPDLHREASRLGYAQSGNAWDPFAFVRFWEGKTNEELAKRVQFAEWQLLFDYCTAPATSRVATR